MPIPVTAIKDSSTSVQAVPKPPASFFSRWRKQILAISAIALVAIGAYVAYNYFGSPIMPASVSIREAATVMSAPTSIPVTTTPITLQEDAPVLPPACAEITDLAIFKHYYEHAESMFKYGYSHCEKLAKRIIEQVACCRTLEKTGATDIWNKCWYPAIAEDRLHCVVQYTRNYAS